MAILEERVHSFVKKSSSVEPGERVVRKITRSDVAALNKTIEPKIRQNERERAASMHAAAKCIVGIR